MNVQFHLALHVLSLPVEPLYIVIEIVPTLCGEGTNSVMAPITFSGKIKQKDMSILSVVIGHAAEKYRMNKGFIKSIPM